MQIEITNEEAAYISEHRLDNLGHLALKISSAFNFRKDVILRQIDGWQVIRRKVPMWADTDGIICPMHLSLEQCSSQATALYKAGLAVGNSFVDLTGGLGVDFSFMASRFAKATYVEHNQELCDLAHNNFKLLGLGDAQIICAEADDALAKLPDCDCIYLDPARRDSAGGRTVLLEDCTPNLIQLLPLLLQKAKTVIAKLSPMLDIKLALANLPHTRQIHVVASDNECKELLFIINGDFSGDPEVVCANITSIETQVLRFNLSEESYSYCQYSEPLKYIYEPNAAIMKGGGFRSLAKQMNLKKIHKNSHLYTSDTLVNNFPGRSFEVETVFGMNKRDIKIHLNDVSKANIAVRNFPLSVAELRKRLKITDGGDTYIFATTIGENEHVLIKTHKS